LKVAIVTDRPRFQFLPTEEGIMEDRQMPANWDIGD